ncbi:hypothetical protein AtNW77_Chr1g0048681 [Arabidopsis thaliana]
MPRSFFHMFILSSFLQHKRLGWLKSESSLDFCGEMRGLRKANNKIWFQDGWQEFVNRFSIRIGFRYKVTVYIFNLSSTL